MTTRPILRVLGATAVAVAFLVSSPALSAAEPGPLLAKGSYWSGFVEFWTSRVVRQEGVVLIAIGVGIVSLFIITRSKWKK
jgi:hypothetical protein